MSYPTTRNDSRIFKVSVYGENTWNQEVLITFTNQPLADRVAEAVTKIELCVGGEITAERRLRSTVRFKLFPPSGPLPRTVPDLLETVLKTMPLWHPPQ